ncbi:nitroreductase/quinone reductase family protein [Amycolatopsis sp. NPDC005003]
MALTRYTRASTTSDRTLHATLSAPGAWRNAIERRLCAESVRFRPQAGGAKTGKLRKTPLMRVEHNGEYAVVGSRAGAPQNPVWVHNPRKDPHVELQDGTEKHDCVAREIEGDERAVEAAPDYADFEKKTDRLIPVFVPTRTPE